MSAIAKLTAMLGLDGSQFKAGMDGAKREVSSFDSKLHSMAGTLKTGLGAAGIFAALHKISGAVKELKEQSDKGMENPLFSKQEIDRMAQGFERVDQAITTSKSVVGGWMGNFVLGLQGMGYQLAMFASGSSWKEAGDAAGRYMNHVEATAEQTLKLHEAEDTLAKTRQAIWFGSLSGAEKYTELMRQANQLDRDASLLNIGARNLVHHGGAMNNNDPRVVEAHTAAMKKQEEALRLRNAAEQEKNKVDAEAAKITERDAEQEKKLAGMRFENAAREKTASDRALDEKKKLSDMEKELADFKGATHGSAGDADVKREETRRGIEIEGQRRITDEAEKQSQEEEKKNKHAEARAEKLRNEVAEIEAITAATDKQGEAMTRINAIDAESAKILADNHGELETNGEDYMRLLELQKERASVLSGTGKDIRSEATSAANAAMGGRGSVHGMGGWIGGAQGMAVMSDPLIGNTGKMVSTLDNIEKLLRARTAETGTPIVGDTP